MEYYNIDVAGSTSSETGLTPPGGAFHQILSPFSLITAEVSNPMQAGYSANNSALAINYAEVAQILSKSLASLRVHVVESDITETQNSVKAIVEQATF